MMDIEKAKKLRKKLESDIRQALCDFSENTKLTADVVAIKSYEMKLNSKEEPIAVNYEVSVMVRL